MRARAVLLLPVLAAGVLCVSPRASAHTASSHRWQSGATARMQVEQESFRATATQKSLRISLTNGATGATLSTYEILACPWTSVTPANSMIRPTGCTVIVDRPSNTLPFNVNVTPTAAMIANGGFAVVFVDHAGSFGRPVDVSDWVHLLSPAIVVSPTALTVTEGTSPAATYTVRLGGRPSGGVRVRVTRGDGSYTVRKAGGTGTSSEDLDFTTSNWNTGQTVTVTALTDPNAVGGTSNITHETVDADTAAEFDPVSKTLPVTVNDDDAAIAVSRGTGALRLTEGVATTYRVALGGAPTGPVVVDVTSADAGAVTVAPGALTFTATTWNTGRTVTARAVPDADMNAETVTVTHAVDDASSADEFDPAPDVTFPVNVREAAIAVSRGTGPLALTEGSSATYTVALGGPPTGPVVVDVTSADAGAVAAAPGALTFTATTWDTGRTVTLSAVEDGDMNAETLAVTHAVDDGSSADEFDPAPDVAFQVNVTDDDTPGLAIDAAALTMNGVDEGSTATYTLALAAQPTGPVTVTISSSNADVPADVDGDAGNGAQTTLTFTATTWNTARTVTVRAAQDADRMDDAVTWTHAPDGANYAGAADVGLAFTVNDDDDVRAAVMEDRWAQTAGWAEYDVVTPSLLATETRQQVRLVRQAVANWGGAQIEACEWTAVQPGTPGTSGPCEIFKEPGADDRSISHTATLTVLPNMIANGGVVRWWRGCRRLRSR